jgi:hypothetical protein
MPFVIFKVRDVDGNHYPGVIAQGTRDSVPEILNPKLTGTIWQGRVENKPQSIEEIRFANLVFAKNHGRSADGQI